MKKITLTINGKEQTLTEGSVVEVVHRPLGQSAFALTSTIGYFTDVLDWGGISDLYIHTNKNLETGDLGYGYPIRVKDIKSIKELK